MASLYLLRAICNEGLKLFKMTCVLSGSQNENLKNVDHRMDDTWYNMLRVPSV